MMPPTGTTAKMMKAGTVERYGASLKVNESDCSGTRSSLKISLVPSASVCSSPQGPARFGPMRLCMSEITLRSNQIIMAVADQQHHEGHQHLDDEDDPDLPVEPLGEERVAETLVGRGQR